MDVPSQCTIVRTMSRIAYRSRRKSVAWAKAKTTPKRKPVNSICVRKALYSSPLSSSVNIMS